MDEHTLTLTTLAYGGDALGRLPDGRAVFVPFALPGEVVRVRLVEEKRRYARGELLEVLEPVDVRIAPRCTHFGECGGCHYQHMPYAVQLQSKADILRDQLERIGEIEEPPVQPAISAPQPFNYRNHVQFHLAESGKLGYYRASGQSVLPVQECHLPQGEINQLWPRLDFEYIPDLERVGIRVGSEHDLQVILESGDIQAPSLLVEELPVSIVHTSPAGTLVLAGSESLQIEVLDRRFQVSAGSFFQVNTDVAGLMVELLLNQLKGLGAMQGSGTIVDAYCGVGLFSAFLAPEAKKLIGIESSPSACDDFVTNLDDFNNVELYEAGVGAALHAIQDTVDVLVLDPPRSGIDRHTIDAIIEKNIPVLVYMSCDPATLARDAKRLTNGGYRMRRAYAVDMFPQTYHIESLSVWMR